MKTDKLVLIDGHSILNRAYYGIPNLTNAQGVHTGAVYGFLNILFKILEEEQPDHLAVCFDVHEKTFRHEIYAEYKGTRKGMPDELREQVPLMKEVLSSMGIVTVEKAGLEADDLLGTLARLGEKEGLSVSLVSGDRDLLQIATEKIKIRIPKTKMGKTEIEDYYAADVVQAYQVTPKGFIELKALMGDTADNIPGVPKVGAKTATELMVSYGSLEGIYAHLEDITKKSVRESLRDNKALADLSLTLATIKTDCELPVCMADLCVDISSGSFYNEKSYALFKRLEFKNFLGRFEKKTEKTEITARELTSVSELEKLFEKAGQKKKIAIYLEGTMVALSVEEGEGLYCIPGDNMSKSLAVALCACIRDGVQIFTFGVKKLYGFLDRCGMLFDELQEAELLVDELIAAYIQNPLKNDHSVEDIASVYLGGFPVSYQELFGKSSVQEAIENKKETFGVYVSTRAELLLRGASPLMEALSASKQLDLLYTLEMPLSLVLYRMEREGILVQREALKRYGESLVSRIAELEEAIFEAAGESFNILSPKQLGEILFGKLQLPGGKKTKTGFSTAADVLEKLSGEYPIVKDILEYRALTKLKSTYADGLDAFIEEDGRIRTSFNQTITATGRISSTEPNLQNIPMRTELGRQIRKVFVPREGYVLMDADYSQIELRILASMSEDEQLIEAYKQEADIHRITASKVFHVAPEQVTDLMRRNAKAVNFGIVYGISSFGLGQDLNISKKEAEGYIRNYFETYPKIKAFLDKCVADAKENGYSVTVYGRRRPIPELSSGNFMQKSFGERVAMNAPIQGTAADIMKRAMIDVDKLLRANKMKSKLLLQVHDELVLECPMEEVEQAKKILTEGMKNASDMKVPLEIELKTGNDWYSAH